MASSRPHEDQFRSPEVMELLPQVDFTICGCGALGAHFAVAMVRMGAKQFTLIDKDYVDIENLGSQPFTRNDLGHTKPLALALLLEPMVYNPESKWDHNFRRFHTDYLTTKKKLWELLPGENGIVIDSFDNYGARVQVAEDCNEWVVPCLHIGMIEDFGSVIWDKDYVVPQDPEDMPDNCAHPFSLSLVYRVVSAAIESTMEYIETGHKVSYRIRGMEIERYE